MDRQRKCEFDWEHALKSFVFIEYFVPGNCCTWLTVFIATSVCHRVRIVGVSTREWVFYHCVVRNSKTWHTILECCFVHTLCGEQETKEEWHYICFSLSDKINWYEFSRVICKVDKLFELPHCSASPSTASPTIMYCDIWRMALVHERMGNISSFTYARRRQSWLIILADKTYRRWCGTYLGTLVSIYEAIEPKMRTVFFLVHVFVYLHRLWRVLEVRILIK